MLGVQIPFAGDLLVVVIAWEKRAIIIEPCCTNTSTDGLCASALVGPIPVISAIQTRATSCCCNWIIYYITCLPNRQLVWRRLLWQPYLPTKKESTWSRIIMSRFQAVGRTGPLLKQTEQANPLLHVSFSLR